MAGSVNTQRQTGHSACPQEAHSLEAETGTQRDVYSTAVYVLEYGHVWQPRGGSAFSYCKGVREGSAKEKPRGQGPGGCFQVGFGLGGRRVIV